VRICGWNMKIKRFVTRPVMSVQLYFMWMSTIYQLALFQYSVGVARITNSMTRY